MIRKHTHIGSYGIISNDNKIVLITKARGGYTGLLDLPGGGIEHNESPEVALKREIFEEVGATITKYKLIDVKDNNITWKVKDNYYEDLHHIGIIYSTEIENNKIKEEPDGIDSLGAKWYNLNELDDNKLTPFAKYAYKYLINKYHNLP